MTEINFDKIIENILFSYYFPEKKEMQNSESQEMINSIRKNMNKDNSKSFEDCLKMELKKLLKEKTIEKEIENKPFYIRISGKITEKSLYKSFYSLLKDYNNEDLHSFGLKQKEKQEKKFIIINIDITEIKNIEYLDDFLFNLCILRMIRLDGHIRMLPFDTRIKIELVPSTQFKIFDNLQILSLLSHLEVKNSLSNLHFDKNPEGDLQIVCKYFNLIDANNEKNFVLSKENRKNLIDLKNIKKLLQKHIFEEINKIKPNIDKEYITDFLTFDVIFNIIRVLKQEFEYASLLFQKNKMSNSNQIKIIKLIQKTTILQLIPFKTAYDIQKQAFEKIQDKKEVKVLENKNEWNTLPHRYIFATKYKFLFVLQKPIHSKKKENFFDEFDNLTQKIKNKEIILTEEKEIHKKYKEQIRENILPYHLMPEKYYISELTIMSKAMMKDLGLKSPKNLDVRVNKILKNMNNFEKGKGYQINVDNFTKMMMILQKVRNRLPITIMGETGCGKTYLLKFLVEEILYELAYIYIKTMNFGVTIEEFKVFILEGIKSAQKNPKKTIWLFFDEFNTSSLQSYVNEMMFSRRFSLLNSFGTKLEK